MKQRDHFDSNYIKKFCPRQLNQFVFSPANGASDCLFTCWNGNQFRGKIVLINMHSITRKFISLANGKVFHHTNIYGPPSLLKKLVLFLGYTILIAQT